jgi:Ca-activated chloride channel family protein
VLVEQLAGTLITIAKDVKIQIEFNPAAVQSYRLLGYENRLLRAEDFNDDRKDAGEIGAGHTVTALYELVPTGKSSNETDNTNELELKYQAAGELTEAAQQDELLTLKLRYKQPEGDESKLLEFTVSNEVTEFESSIADHRFAAAVAAFGMLLRDSEHRGSATYEDVQSIAKTSQGQDPHGYRAEFVSLVAKAKQLAPAMKLTSR